ncbi:ABC transporter substrate-binding protein [Streptomyces genisteinicus]|uniref:Protein kinase n=1 Tax=Streptomyces genisteinicus TaxID=2768068 RepID=A0A7H0HWS1_9ACTN|nr:ABC transporter substrate-binding protein [Streptomyces genisteinicus]QNP64987.1 protein kinase [Streptomyces genisteinicus]
MQALDAADPRQVGRYRILARLGAGGMGRVYLGRSTSGRMVAVKVVRDELAGEPDFQRRFAREVEAARRVTGFFTAAVVDADPAGSPAWLATAYVPGLPLEEAVRVHGAWPRASLLVLGAGLVEALEAIHAAGLIHRDLKPSNVLLAADGPRVIDFGISIVTEASALTQTGMVIGTPGFMSPEQVMGQSVGPASDVFALGAVLAFAGTGTSPFGTGAAHSVNFRAVYQDPELRGLPPETEFIRRCLEKDPAQRPTLPELLAEFGRLLGDTGAHTLAGGLPEAMNWLPPAIASAVAGRDGSAPPVPASDPRIDLAKRPGEQTPAPRPDPSPTPGPVPDAAPPPPSPADASPPPGPAAGTTPAPWPGTTRPQGEPAPPSRPPAFPPPSVPPHLVSGPVTPYPAHPKGPGADGPARARRRRITAIALTVALVAGGGVTGVVLKMRADDRKEQTQGQGDGKGDATPAKGFDAAVGHVVNASDKKGGTLRLVSSQDADSWDPARSYYGWVWNTQRLYTRTLLTYAPEPGGKGLELVPDLAEAEPEVSADGRTYTLTLRSGLTFEDGSPITSADVKYGIERTFAQDLLAGGPTYLVEKLDQGQDYPGPYRGGATGLKSVGTPDDRTIVFTLAEADSQFPYLLTLGATAPVPRAKDTGKDYGTKPVSSGPYRFDSYEPGRRLVLVRNENWDAASDPLRKALPDKVELTVTNDPEAAEARLLAGDADLDAAQTGLSQQAVIKVLGDEKLKTDADNPHSGYLRMVTMISKTAPLDNADCRKALVYATGTDNLRSARGGPSFGSLHGNTLPPTLLGADSYDPFGVAKGKQQLDKAAEALKACGKPDGFTVKAAVRGENVKDVTMATALRNQLKAAGITLEIEEFDDFGGYYSAIGSPSTQKKKNIAVLILGWGADYPTGAGFLQPLADSRQLRPSGNSNYAQIEDPRIDELFDKAAAETDPAAAGRIYQEINHRVTDGAYYLPIMADKTVAYRNPRLTNVYVHQAFNLIDIQALGTGGS